MSRIFVRLIRFLGERRGHLVRGARSQGWPSEKKTICGREFTIGRHSKHAASEVRLGPEFCSTCSVLEPRAFIDVRPPPKKRHK